VYLDFYWLIQKNGPIKTLSRGGSYPVTRGWLYRKWTVTRGFLPLSRGGGYEIAGICGPIDLRQPTFTYRPSFATVLYVAAEVAISLIQSDDSDIGIRSAPIASHATGLRSGFLRPKVHVIYISFYVPYDRCVLYDYLNPRPARESMKYLSLTKFSLCKLYP